MNILSMVDKKITKIILGSLIIYQQSGHKWHFYPINMKDEVVSKLKICDMIKGNESDLRNIDFELLA